MRDVKLSRDHWSMVMDALEMAICNTGVIVWAGWCTNIQSMMNAREVFADILDDIEGQVEGVRREKLC